jgi:hypothetical protein
MFYDDDDNDDTDFDVSILLCMHHIVDVMQQQQQ